MIYVVICGLLLLVFFAVNWKTRKTNAYKNFYRAIHVVKDVPPKKKYKYAAFGSTFAYYAYDLKEYNGHNFSVEPQSISYMKKTIDCFLDNIESGGVALISLAGCFFAAASSTTDESCTTYYSFLKPHDFNHFRRSVNIKYLLKRYFPALSLHYLKCIFKDEPLRYSIKNGISYDIGKKQAQKRILGWEKVVGKPITQNFEIDSEIERKLNYNIEIMREIISTFRTSGVIPVFVVLPMSKAFNECCPSAFYDQILYRCLNELKSEDVKILDYLYNKELNCMEYFFTSDCLNANGRKKLTAQIIKDIENLVVSRTL